MSEPVPRSFPPDVFARLAPDIYFERHLQQGLRPTGRGLDEFRPIHVQKGDQSELIKSSLGAAVVRAGEATVICGISGGLTDFEHEGGVYANVEIYRGGRNTAPTPEEMVLTQRVHKLVQAAQIDPSNFVVKAESDFAPTTKELVLTASIRVLSRTGPSLDLVWTALVAALEDTLVPNFAYDERLQKVIPDFTERHHLDLPETLAATCSTFGLSNGLVLADPDGPTEESCVRGYATIAKSANGSLCSFSLISPHEPASLAAIKQALAGAGTRPITD